VNYYEARQVSGSDPPNWHFTGENDGHFFLEGCNKSCVHATPEEACAHWVEFQIGIGFHHSECGWTHCDNREGADIEGRIRLCPKPAKEAIRVGGPNGGHYTLCADHAADNIAEALFRLENQGAFQIVSSF